jgi:hypothetical protein
VRSILVRLSIFEPWELATEPPTIVEGQIDTLHVRQAQIRCRAGSRVGEFNLEMVTISPRHIGDSLSQMVTEQVHLNCAGYNRQGDRLDFLALGWVVSS